MKKRLTTTRKDEIFKKFWNQNDHFASLLNTVLFEGKPMISPEELGDSNDGENAETPGEMNTVVKKTGHGAEFVLTGIKDPRDIPLQLLYQDSVGYLKECQEILKGRGENKEDMDEVLDALHEEDKLKPIINLVLYYGKEPWNGATSLKEMFPHVPEKIREVFPDYRINLIQARDAEHYHFDNKDLQDAFTLAELAYKDEMDKVYAYLKDNKVGSDVAAMAGVFADHDSLIESGLEMDKDAAGCGAKCHQ